MSPLIEGDGGGGRPTGEETVGVRPAVRQAARRQGLMERLMGSLRCGDAPVTGSPAPPAEGLYFLFFPLAPCSALSEPHPRPGNERPLRFTTHGRAGAARLRCVDGAVARRTRPRRRGTETVHLLAGSDRPAGGTGDFPNGRSNGRGIMLEKNNIYNHNTRPWAGLRFKVPGRLSVPDLPARLSCPSSHTHTHTH